jgi:hypothetical protein
MGGINILNSTFHRLVNRPWAEIWRELPATLHYAALSRLTNLADAFGHH